jgi:hypothetical protein
MARVGMGNGAAVDAKRILAGTGSAAVEVWSMTRPGAMRLTSAFDVGRSFTRIVGVWEVHPDYPRTVIDNATGRLVVQGDMDARIEGSFRKQNGVVALALRLYRIRAGVATLLSTPTPVEGDVRVEVFAQAASLRDGDGLVVEALCDSSQTARRTLDPLDTWLRAIPVVKSSEPRRGIVKSGTYMLPSSLNQTTAAPVLGWSADPAYPGSQVVENSIVVPSDGIYRMTAALTLDFGAVAHDRGAALYVDGTQVAVDTDAGGSTRTAYAIQEARELRAGQRVSLRAWANAGREDNRNVSAGSLVLGW